MTTTPSVTRPDRQRWLVLLALGVALLFVTFVGLLVGSVSIGLSDLWHLASTRLGISDDIDTLADSVLWAIRLPRLLAGLVAGAGLGIAGVALQGTFRNPIADPHLVGIAPAAGLGAVAGIAMTPAGGNPLIMMVGAAIGAIVFALVIARIATNTLEPVQLVLVGVVFGFALLAALGAVVLAWDSPRVPTFTFWVFGGLTGSTWSMLAAGTPLVVIGSVGVVLTGRSLDLLALGEDAASHLGVDVARLKAGLMVAVGLVVGGAVGLAGVVGFVGLVVPLVLRRIVGPSHRSLAVLSGLGAAVALAGLDVVARTIAAPVEIPVGLLTAVVGAPVLAWSLLRRPR